MGCCVLVYNVEAKELVMNVAFNINLCNVGITISWFKFNKVLSCYIKSPKDRKVIQCYIKPSLIRYSKSVKIKHDNPRHTYSFKLHVNTSQSRISLFYHHILEYVLLENLYIVMRQLIFHDLVLNIKYGW